MFVLSAFLPLPAPLASRRRVRTSPHQFVVFHKNGCCTLRFFLLHRECTLWFLDRSKVKTPRKDKVLFLDARHIFHQVDRAHRDFLPDQIEFLANIVRLYRGEPPEITNGSTPMMNEKFLGVSMLMFPVYAKRLHFPRSRRRAGA